MPSDQRLKHKEYLLAKNASAERKLNQHLKYVDRLKRTFERRSDQERMLFAVRHWTVQKPARLANTPGTQTESPRPDEISQSSQTVDSAPNDNDTTKTDAEQSSKKSTPAASVRNRVPPGLLSLRRKLPFATAPKKVEHANSQQDDMMKDIDQGLGNLCLSAEFLRSRSNVVGRVRADLPRLCRTIDFTEYLSSSGNPRSIRELIYNKGSSSVEKWKSMAASIDPSKPVKKNVSDMRHPSNRESVTRPCCLKLDGDGAMYSRTFPAAGGRMVPALRGNCKAEAHLCCSTWVSPEQSVQSDMPQVVSNCGSGRKDELFKQFDGSDLSQDQVGRSAAARGLTSERLQSGCLRSHCRKDARFSPRFKDKASLDPANSPNDIESHLPADREKNVQGRPGRSNKVEFTEPDTAPPQVATSGGEAEQIYQAREKILQTMATARWKARKMELKDSKKRLFLIRGAENVLASNCTLIKFMSKTAQANHIKTAQWTMRYELA